MRTIKLTLEYDGAGFCGWQLQRPGLRTVQGEMERGLLKLLGEEVRVLAAGRTDSGVHALGQVACFKTAQGLPLRAFSLGLNSLLPDDVKVLEAAEASPDFHARHSAVSKWYRYLALDREEDSALWHGRAYHYRWPLDLLAMRAAAAPLLGEHDFSSFRSAGCEAKTPVRELKRIEIYRDGAGLARFDFWGTGFLKQMVRSIVGTLLEVGSGRRAAGELAEILAARDRARAGPTAPAWGLYLLRVDYDE